MLSVFLLASRTGRFEGWFAAFVLIEARSHPPFARSWFVRRSTFSVLSSTAMTLVALSLIATIGTLRRPSQIPAHLLRPFRAHPVTASYHSGPVPAAPLRWTRIQRGYGFRRKPEPRRPDRLHVRSEHMHDAHICMMRSKKHRRSPSGWNCCAGRRRSSPTSCRFPRARPSSRPRSRRS